MKLSHPRALLRDVSYLDGERWWARSSRIRNPLSILFAAISLGQSSSYVHVGSSRVQCRIYEAMEAGAVPVLVADRVALPDGPDWEQFCLRISECEVTGIPKRLEELEDRAAIMGAQAQSGMGEILCARE